jgi:hypothetical protein
VIKLSLFPLLSSRLSLLLPLLGRRVCLSTPLDAVTNWYRAVVLDQVALCMYRRIRPRLMFQPVTREGGGRKMKVSLTLNESPRSPKCNFPEHWGRRRVTFNCSLPPFSFYEKRKVTALVFFCSVGQKLCKEEVIRRCGTVVRVLRQAVAAAFPSV